MALVDIGQRLRWPGYSLGITSLAFAAMNTIDGSGDQCTYIMEAEEDMVVDRIGFRPNSVTSSPTAIVCIETVVANAASGTLFNNTGGGSTGTTGVLSTSSMNVTTLAAAATISKGQRYAIVIRWNGVGSFVTSSITRPLIEGTFGYPFKATNVSGSNVRSAFACHPVILGSSSTNFYRIPGFLPIVALGTTAIANNQTARAACLKFRMKMACRIMGLRIMQSNASITDDYTISLQDGGASATADVGATSRSFDADDAFIQGSGTAEHQFANTFDPVVDTWYRAVFQGDTTGTSSINYMTLENADHAKAMPSGLDCILGERDASGDWTDYATRIPVMDLILNRLDNGVSVGGGAGFASIGL